MYCLLSIYIYIKCTLLIYMNIYTIRKKRKNKLQRTSLVVVSLAHNHSYYILHKIIMVMTGGIAVKNLPASAGDAEDLGLIPGL